MGHNGLDGRGLLDCSVGIMAYNEEDNIAHAIASIFGQRVQSGRVSELIVVASGCEDRTCAIVSELARQDDRLRLIVQDRREGKASAINIFLQTARAPLLLMVSADVVLKEGTIDALLRHFADPRVGMVGGHPTPVNTEATFLGHAVHLQWRLHDHVARQDPKLGEIVAFRHVVPSIPHDTAVDEFSIQAMVSQLGYRLVYEPEAVIYNRGPTTVEDFLRQRRRIYAGHLKVRRQQGYSPPTMDTRKVGSALLRSGAFSGPKSTVWTLGTIGLEACARGLGHWDNARGQKHHIWAISGTTKRDVAAGASERQTVAVFHIVDFHRHRLELGLPASRHLSRVVAEHVRESLGPEAVVSEQDGGTVVALLRGGREAAEGIVAGLVREFAGAVVPIGHSDALPDVTLACGLLEFDHADPPVATAFPLRARATVTALAPAGLEMATELEPVA